MDPCPRHEQLDRLLAEQLADAQRGAVEAHVEVCPACQQALAALAGPGGGLPAPRHRLGTAFRLQLELACRATLPSQPGPRADGAWPCVPGYEVLGEIGRGGMGVVYRARQTGLNRTVALKVILSGAHAGVEERNRFRREAEAVARLQHPHVVQVFEVGEHGGLPFLALEDVAGGSLAQKLQGGPLPEPEAARLTETLARAVQAAHDKGVIHRDLKPANVLLTPDGQPKVADFGLARRLDGDSVRTRTGQVLGTPSYVAPEQAAGAAREVGPPADVYALGAVLYEMLTGRPPFRAATALDTLVQVRHQEPRPPRALNPGVSRGLEAVCLKCLEKDPARRYESARALADDLASWRAGEPVRARPPGWARRAWRVLRRPAARVTAVGLLAALTVVLALRGTAPSPEEVEARQQGQRWAAIQRDLAAGRPVTLIGAAGRPAAWRWRSAAAAGPTLADDGTFSVEHLEFGLLELLPDPLWESYTFRAEVRHDRGWMVEGQVGIYFAHSEHATDPGPTHAYAAVAFNDLIDQNLLRPAPDPQGNLMALRAHSHPPAFADHSTAVVGGSHAPFAFPAPGEKPWRRLEVEVTPGRVRVRCGERWVVDQPWAALAEEFEKMRPAAPIPAAARPPFAPRAGLGLYVRQGAASFRRVQVEPLIDRQ
jgi:serine/threonine-protein kinase